MTTQLDPGQVFDEILAKFAAHGSRHYGENVTELEHALQCAAAAERAGDPPGLVVACLLHDYGHLLHELGEDIADRGVDAQHEELGAEVLASYFPPEIVEPVRMHVDAKRYLSVREPGYLENLSGASRLSLELQGGPMNDDEADAFEANPHFEWAIRLRRHDEGGKVIGKDTKQLLDYREMVTQFVKQ